MGLVNCDSGGRPCARDEMENRIKEAQLVIRSNRFREFIAAFHALSAAAT